MNFKNLLKTLGPGLLFASAAIGTSHLVLSTRAGAHYGMIFLWVILGALILKYPFFEFGPRYANATGHSLLHGYKKQGVWATTLFFLVIVVGMFAVPAAVGAVSAGLLSTMMGMSGIPMPYLFGGILVVTGLILILGGYTTLDNFVKLISIVLLLTMIIAFIAVLAKGPIEVTTPTASSSILEGAGLALLISLVGWMPSGLETSTMHSIWAVEKMKSSSYHPTKKEGLFDFNFGYAFTTLLALMFLVIGAFTIYGSGQKLTGSSTEFSNQLLSIFTTNLGQWLKPIIAVAAFGTIYGTLITAWDAFARSFIWSIRSFKYDEINHNVEQDSFLNTNYRITIAVIGVGAFLLFMFFQGAMIAILEFASSASFVAAPIIGFINLKAIRDKSFPESHKPPVWIMTLAYIGIIAMTLFTAYYLYHLLIIGGGGGH